MALKSTQLGMTLIEVMVAMTLMVIISAISFASLNGLLNAKIHTDSAAVNFRKELLLNQQLTNDIQAIVLRSVRDKFGAKRPAILGKYAFIEFTKNGHVNPLNQRRSDLQRVQWVFQNSQIIRRSNNNIDEGNFTKWQERVYLDEVKEFSLSYENQVGKIFRTWPVSNQTGFVLKVIHVDIVLKSDKHMKLLITPLSL